MMFLSTDVHACFTSVFPSMLLVRLLRSSLIPCMSALFHRNTFLLGGFGLLDVGTQCLDRSVSYFRASEC